MKQRKNKILFGILLAIFGAALTAALFLGAVFFRHEIKNLILGATFTVELTNPEASAPIIQAPIAEPSTTQKPEYKIQIISEKLEQSDILVVEIDGPNLKSGTAIFNSQKIQLALIENQLFGFIGIAPKTQEGKYPLEITIDSGENFNYEISIQKRKFLITRLILPEKLIQEGVTPEKLAQNIASTDKPTLDSILKKITPEAHFKSGFREPLKNWVDVGAYGNIRESGNTQIQHLGVDLEGAFGEPVYASNDGVVRFAGELADFGNTVIIDHGAGIFTLYLHMSKILTAKDKGIKRGETLGQVGSSGEYSLDTHLHFSVKVNGASVDPRRFLDAVNKFLKEDINF